MTERIGFKRCCNGHIIGQMRHYGNGNTLLELFRLAIDRGQDLPDEVDVIGVFVAGYQIRCSVCGQVVDFHQSANYSGAVSTVGEQES